MFLFLSLATLAMADVPECRDLDLSGHGTRAHSADVRRPKRLRVGLFKNTAWLGLRFYQKVISPGDGGRCSMYPTCSGYAMRAVDQHGPVLGTWMSTARILRKHSDPAFPVCTHAGQTWQYNVPADDAWWK